MSYFEIIKMPRVLFNQFESGLGRGEGSRFDEMEAMRGQQEGWLKEGRGVETDGRQVGNPDALRGFDNKEANSKKTPASPVVKMDGATLENMNKVSLADRIGAENMMKGMQNPEVLWPPSGGFDTSSQVAKAHVGGTEGGNSVEKQFT